MKVVGLVSGGKDSCYAMMRCIDYGHEIVALANLLPLEDSIDELDSYMYQTVGHQIVISYAECMGLPLFRRRIHGSSRHQHLSYKVTSDDEVEDMFILLNEVKQQIPSITAVSSGAIASDYQRLRVESVCSRLGLVSLAYLWKQDQSVLLEDMIRKGIMAILIKVAAIGLDPAKHLGREIADLQAQLFQLKELYGINVCGEGGEYETLTLDCPLFKNARIVLDSYQVVLHSADSIAPVGILHPLASHLEPQRHFLSSNNTCDRNEVDPENIARVYEVQGDCLPDDMANCLPVNLTSNAIVEEKLQISRTEGDTFSMGCWIQNSSGTSDGLQEDLTAILWKIESQLSEGGLEWANVLYIHLYISDMNEFALANEVYLRFISEKKCFWGVPSRSTIELPLMQVGLGNAYIEVLVTKDQSKRVLHVQSISCWAPSCIGPYSQATLHKEILHMAGQLGLDPPTMMLCSGGPTAEMEQALENCEAVATCFNCSAASSALLFVIYCSACITTSERIEIQHKMESFLGPKIPNLQSRGFSRACPLSLYVLVPNLPKRALVEVKPVLYIPEDGDPIVPTTVPDGAHKGEENYWNIEHSNLYDSCCQKYIGSGKICTTLVSITNDIAAELCSTDQDSKDLCCYSSEKHMKTLAHFCINVLSRTLLENDFSWKDVKNMRIYFKTTLCASVDVLNLTFSEAFGEFGNTINSLELGKKPIFNLIPVLSVGRSAAMDDFITCELFASKL